MLYDRETLVWAALLGYILRRDTRNKMDCARNDVALAESVLRLSGQGVEDWPDGERLTVPCSETFCGLLKHGGAPQIQRAITDMVAHLIRKKRLECARFRGYVVVAVDGVEQEVARRTKGAKETETRYMLEFKVIAPNGLALSTFTERVKPHATESGKRDCELKALKRGARHLRKAFPRLPICLVGDALYACAPVMRICRDYGWKFILTFKEGRSPDAYELACDSMEVSKGQCGTLVVLGKNQRKIDSGVVAWTGGVKFTTQKEGEEFNIVACEEHEKRRADDGSETEKTGYHGMFATNFDVSENEIASEVIAWGRRRWNIESSFNVEKHGGYGLEHSFCSDWRCSRCLYLLMQLAHNLWQIYNACVLPKVAEGCRKMGQAEWVELLRRYFHMVGIRADFATLPRRYIRRMNL